MTKRRGVFASRFALALAAVTVTGAMTAQAQFAPGNVVVSVSGTNPTAGDPSIAPLSLVEFTTSGDPTGTVVSLPMLDTPLATGTNFAITGNVLGTALYGALKRSVNREYLTITAANVPVNTSTSALIGGVFSTIAFPNRTIARIDSAGNVDTTTRFAARGSTPKGVASTDGQRLWWAANSGSSDSGGVRYLTLGGTVAGSLLTGIGTSTNSRSNTNGIGIFADQLYIPYNVGPFRGVYALGNGLPESGGPLVATAVVSATSANDFYFGDSNTLYVAVSDTDAGLVGLGLQKWVRSEGGPWTNVWTSSPGGSFGILGLTGSVNGGLVDLYAVTFGGAGISTANSLVKLGDTLAGTQFPVGGFTTLVTSTTGSLFRGVAFAPVPEPATLAIGLAGLAAAAVAGARRRAGQQRR